jgi:hypothetical protein
VTVLEWAQLVALVAAAGFFFAKAAAGYFLVNMAIDASATRQSLNDTQDAIAVTIRLTKGGNGSLRIHDTLVTVSWPSGEIATVLSGVSRLELQQIKGRGSTSLDRRVRTRADLSTGLPPGDATAFSASVPVPRECSARSTPWSSAESGSIAGAASGGRPSSPYRPADSRLSLRQSPSIRIARRHGRSTTQTSSAGHRVAQSFDTIS